MTLDKRSEERMRGVHPDLICVVHRAFDLSPIKFIVTEGLRSLERQTELYAQGRTKPGNKVTWTMQSKHLTGDAVDIAPLVDGKPQYIVDAIKVIGKAMLDAAKELGVRIRWGYDFNENGILMERGESDGPHFELKH